MNQAETNLDHESRISALETSIDHIKQDMHKIVKELSSVRLALWVVAVAVTLASTPNLKEAGKLIISILL